MEKIYVALSQASILLPIILGSVYYARFDKAFRMLFVFLIIAAIFEIQAKISGVIFHNNMPGLHLYTLIEMLAFSAVYYLDFSKNKGLSLLIIINAIIFIVIAFADAIFINGIKAPNNVSRTYSAISLTCYALAYFYYLFKINAPFYSWQYPMFWLSISVLLYFGLNTFYFMLANYLFNNTIVVGEISSYVHAAINIISNCLIAQAFRCYRN